MSKFSLIAILAFQPFRCFLINVTKDQGSTIESPRGEKGRGGGKRKEKDLASGVAQTIQAKEGGG